MRPEVLATKASTGHAASHHQQTSRPSRRLVSANPSNADRVEALGVVSPDTTILPRSEP